MNKQLLKKVYEYYHQTDSPHDHDNHFWLCEDCGDFGTLAELRKDETTGGLCPSCGLHCNSMDLNTAIKVLDNRFQTLVDEIDNLLDA